MSSCRHGKRALSKGQAKRTAKAMRHRTGCDVRPYLCECGSWHVKSEPRRNRPARPDPFELELADTLEAERLVRLRREQRRGRPFTPDAPALEAPADPRIRVALRSTSGQWGKVTA